MESENSHVRSEGDAFIPVGGLIAPEIKRKEFLEYLMKTEFLKNISKMVLALSEEENLPEAGIDVLDYISKLFGYKHGEATGNKLEEAEKMEKDLEDEVCSLERENHILRRLLDNYESSETPVPILDPTDLPPIAYQKKTKSHLNMKKATVQEHII